MQQVKAALLAAGLEVYRAQPTEIRVAERVRLHIMDAGVRVEIGNPSRILFTARCQRSDFPHESDERLFARVRAAVGELARARGYAEATAVRLEIKDPMDTSRILDVWHEITYARVATDLDAIPAEIRWALSLEKCVTAQY